MNAAARYRRVESLFESARTMPAAERLSWLEREESDAGVRDEVARLLQFDETDALPLDASPAAGLHDESEINAAIPSIPGYTIDRVIGRGGMGIVYAAEQDAPPRPVAIKVVASGAYDDRLIDRFRHEAAVLARLEHASIARLYDFGVFPSPAGGKIPFFAMEWIDGSPIDVFIQTRAPSLRERISLLSDICDAVAFAHGCGVIHRDLKPANILIDADGHPHIVDFGVARLLDQDVAGASARTMTGQFIGTPAYMSPEQAGSSTHPIDVRSDVYALGVVGWETFAGRLPIDLQGSSVHEQLARVRTKAIPALARDHPECRGDLSTVVAKATHRDPAMRYSSATEFAADLRAVVARRPVTARTPSLTYRVSRLLARRPWTSAAAAVGGLAVSASLIAAFVLDRQATQARIDTANTETKRVRAENDAQVARADAAAADLERVKAESMAQIADAQALASQLLAENFSGFVVDDLINASDPEFTPDGNLTIHDLVDRAMEGVEARFADQPAVAATVFHALGKVYISLLDSNAALEAADAAIRLADIADQKLARDPTAVVHEIEPEIRRDLKRLRGDALDNLDRYDEAIALFRALIVECEAAPEPDDYYILSLRMALGRTLCADSQWQEGLTLLQDCTEAAEATLEPDDPLRFAIESNFVSMLYETGNFEIAMPIFERLTASREASHGPTDLNLLKIRGNYAEMLRYVRRYDDAIDILDGNIQRWHQRGVDPAHPEILICRSNRALNLLELKRFDEAAEHFEALIEEEKSVEEFTPEDRLHNVHNLAGARMQQGRYDEARVLMEDVHRQRIELLGPQNLTTLLTAQMLSGLYMRSGDHADALSLGLPTWQSLVDEFGPDTEYARGLAWNISKAYEKTGKPDLATEWMARAGRTKPRSEPDSDNP